MNKPIFSIIVPMYKGAALIGETIDSVLKQTETDWEMIIVDDCSPDDGKGAATVEKYSKKDHRVKIIRSPKNRGSSGARNLAMENASGRYYAFLDSDDIWDANYLEKMKKHIDENKDESVAIYYCGFRRKDSLCQKDIFPPYKNAGKKSFKRLLYYCTIFPSAAILDTQKLKNKVLFRENLRNLRDDYVFWLDVLRQDLTAMGYNDILVNRRHMDSQLTSSKTNMVYPQWNVYRNVLKLNFMLSLFYMLTWTARGVFKHYILRKR